MSVEGAKEILRHGAEQADEPERKIIVEALEAVNQELPPADLRQTPNCSTCGKEYYTYYGHQCESKP